MYAGTTKKFTIRESEESSTDGLRLMQGEIGSRAIQFRERSGER